MKQRQTRQQQRSVKLKADSLRTETTLINLQPDSLRKKRRGFKSIKLEMKKEVTMDTTETQIIIRDYYKQLYANKMDNIEEMDKFLERYNLNRQNQEDIENINGPIISTEIQTVIKNLPTNKSSGPDGFMGKF